MATSLLQRALNTLELLSSASGGITLNALAQQLPMPKVGAKRLLNELEELGYVAYDSHRDCFLLTTRLSAMAMRYLADRGANDVAQPHLDKLAAQCGELVRLAVAEGQGLSFVAKAQGMRAGLRYDPEPYEKVPLYCTATAFAWLSTFDDEEALARIAADGPMDSTLRGPNLLATPAEILPYLQKTRTQGYCYVCDMSAPGMAAVAVPVFDRGGEHCIGSLVIGAPTARLAEEQIRQHLDALKESAYNLSQLSHLSEYLRHPPA
ncbi:IclR family transcriptional regulator [Marinobacterium sp. D7]|uniref:IclR family transcriptional regulator n=1 Tax=Marinobacterium ramblicola TaxID=2849041 RepID=UPI001C2D0A8C|nr:IclR family transcriptional regulator [Marinobacterium ramblicola]MBV1789754.1 IclR family transcriptional regulator [Marinobacterium ramblicola]